MSRGLPLVSVVVNNYNYARYLGAAIDSALAQTHPALEVIVVDDGSTDESRAVIESYGERVVAVLKPNGGQGSAFNAGFARSRGDVVVFLDADDVLLPQAAARAVERFEPGVVKVHWQLREIDGEGRSTGRLHPHRPLAEGCLREKSVYSGPVAGNSPPTSGNAWSRALLDRLLPMPEESYRISADGYLLTLAWIYGEARALPEPMGLYRSHGENLFASGPDQERFHRHLEKYTHNCEALASHLQAMGIAPRKALWKLWKGVYDAEVETEIRDQLRVIPEGERFILVDEDAWAGWYPRSEAAGAPVVRLPELREGSGSPLDDLDLIGELERLRAAGAGFVVLTADTFAWLDRYPRFGRHLKDVYPAPLWNDYLAVFDLRSARTGRRDRPPVSIVINNHDYGRFLRTAIDSALAQSYAPLEVVVVDDGSTDESRAVIASYGNRIVPVLKANGGQASALNAGFAASRGEVVVFLDADDLLLPTAVERAVEKLAPGVVKVHWPLHEVDADLEPTGRILPTEPLPEGDHREAARREGPSSSVSAPTSGNAWARGFLEQVMPIPELEHRIGADAFLFGLAPLFGVIERLEEPQGRYRVHGKNHYRGTRFEDRLEAGLATIEEQWRLLEAKSPELGLRVDRADWMARSYFHRLASARAEIQALVAPGETLILADEGRWAVDATIAGRPVVPFLERDGAYWGLPTDDAEALRELARLRGQLGARKLAIAWPAFWWLDHYAGFAAHLRGEHRCLLANERLIVFDLQA